MYTDDRPVKITVNEIPATDMRLLCAAIIHDIEEYFKDPAHVAEFEAWQKTRQKEKSNMNRKPAYPLDAAEFLAYQEKLIGRTLNDGKVVGMDELKKVRPADLGQGFKGAAALAGHFNPHAHIIPAIVMDGDAVKVFAVPVAAGTFGLRPGDVRQAQCGDQLIGSVLFGCERHPVVQNDVFLDVRFHMYPPKMVLCR